MTRPSLTTIAIHWSTLQLYESRGIVQNYTISYYPVEFVGENQRSSIRRVTKIVGCEFNHTVIENVNGYTSYALHISANNNGGIGPTGLPVITSATICKISYYVNLLYNIVSCKNRGCLSCIGYFLIITISALWIIILIVYFTPIVYNSHYCKTIA